MVTLLDNRAFVASSISSSVTYIFQLNYLSKLLPINLASNAVAFTSIPNEQFFLKLVTIELVLLLHSFLTSSRILPEKTTAVLYVIRR